MRKLLVLIGSFIATVALADLVHPISEIEVYEIDVLVYEEQINSAWREEVNRAFERAPPGLSQYQLKGEAQKEAQRLYDEATARYNLPSNELPAIRWTLRNNRAGAASFCTDPNRMIFMNEVLFYRNYKTMMEQTIPHEVAHYVACLTNPNIHTTEEYNPHGDHWAKIMTDFGKPANEFHMLDTTPILLYELRVEVIMLTLIVDLKK